MQEFLVRFTKIRRDFIFFFSSGEWKNSEFVWTCVCVFVCLCIKCHSIKTSLTLFLLFFCSMCDFANFKNLFCRHSGDFYELFFSILHILLLFKFSVYMMFLLGFCNMKSLTLGCVIFTIRFVHQNVSLSLSHLHLIHLNFIDTWKREIKIIITWNAETDIWFQFDRCDKLLMIFYTFVLVEDILSDWNWELFYFLNDNR